MNYLEIIQAVLLAAIVALLLRPRNISKKKHYKHKIDGTQEKIWDLEFLRVKVKAMREGFRMQHDKTKEMVDAYEKRLEAEKAQPTQNTETIKMVEAQLARLKPDVDQLVKQMSDIDNQLDGPNGINESIDSYRVVVGMLTEELNKL